MLVRPLTTDPALLWPTGSRSVGVAHSTHGRGFLYKTSNSSYILLVRGRRILVPNLAYILFDDQDNPPNTQPKRSPQGKEKSSRKPNRAPLKQVAERPPRSRV